MLTEKNKGVEYRQWGTESPRAVFLLVHGLGAHAGRWEAFGDFFMKNGISSYAAELGNYYHSDYFKSYYTQILSLYEIAVKHNPGKKVFLIGESVGALISFLLAAGRPGLFSGLVCISPAFANRYKPKFMDFIDMFIPLIYDPNKRSALPFDSSMCTRDINYRKVMDQDSREYRTAPRKLILEILLAQIRAKRIARKITIPVFFLVAGDDKIVDTRAAAAVFDKLTIKNKALMEFPGMYHSLTVELGKESIFEEISKWVDKRINV